MKSLKLFNVEELYKQYPKELKRDDVVSIQEWRKAQPHLPNTTDSEIALFLHASYFNVVKCKKRIDDYYTLRTKCPQVFNNRKIKGEDIRATSNTV